MPVASMTFAVDGRFGQSVRNRDREIWKSPNAEQKHERECALLGAFLFL